MYYVSTGDIDAYYMSGWEAQDAGGSYEHNGGYTSKNDYAAPAGLNTWHQHEIRIVGTDFNQYYEGAYKNDFTDASYNQGHIGFRVDCPAQGSYYFDDVIVRYYLATEPTLTFLSEEQYDAGSSGTVWFNISGFKASTNYGLYTDEGFVETIASTPGGWVRFNHTDWETNEHHFELTDNSTGTTHTETVRTNGEDYFPWLGVNTTASVVDDVITGFDEVGETISHLKSDGTWETWTGIGTGTNFDVYTTDVIKIVLDDGAGTTNIIMDDNGDWDYDEVRTISLKDVDDGYNYTMWTNSALSDLGTEADAMSMANGYFIALWNETNYDWDFHFQGTTINTGTDIHQYDVCVTKISTDRTWNQA